MGSAYFKTQKRCIDYKKNDYTTGNIIDKKRRIYNISIFKQKGFSSLVLIDKSWKTHPEDFKNFNSRVMSPAVLLENLSRQPWKSAACFMRFNDLRFNDLGFNDLRFNDLRYHWPSTLA